MYVLINKLLVLIFSTWNLLPVGYVVFKYVEGLSTSRFDKRLLLLLVPIALRLTFDGRVGAVCCDESMSSSTGSGTCSWHDGVCYWQYEIFTKEYDSEVLNLLVGGNEEYGVATYRTMFND